jgi:hypothetical protein
LPRLSVTADTDEKGSPSILVLIPIAHRASVEVIICVSNIYRYSIYAG